MAEQSPASALRASWHGGRRLLRDLYWQLRPLVHDGATQSSRWEVLRGIAREASAGAGDLAMLERVSPFTMVPPRSVLATATLVRHAIRTGVPGDLVECGVWRGGSAFMMAHARDVADGSPWQRRVWLADSFAGLPPPTVEDGPAARDWAEDPDAPDYFDNCSAALAEVQTHARTLGIENLGFVPGWFDQSLPAFAAQVGSIAVLRIDADWFASVSTCLEELFPLVSAGGYVIFDDYHRWPGCTRAVHEFMVAHEVADPLSSWAGIAFLRRPRA